MIVNFAEHISGRLLKTDPKEIIEKLMKQLSQIIALSFFGLNGLQIILAIGSAIMLFKIALIKLSTIRRKFKVRKMNKEAESNMWAIE